MRLFASKLYYGWHILAAAAVAELLVQGATSYAAGLFVLPLQAEFHISRADASSSVILLYVGSAIVAPVIGRMLDHHSIRRVMTLGAVLFGLAFATIAFSASLWVMAAMLLLPAAAGFMCIGPLASQTLASRWFFRCRGLALGIAAVATSGGGFVVVPLLAQAIRLYGWRASLAGEALIVAVIVIALALLVLRDRPRDVGLDDHAENLGRPSADMQVQAKGPDWRDVVGRSGFWIPTLALALISGSAQAVVVTLVPYGIQLGFGLTEAAFLISVFSIAAAITKILAGALADHVSPRLLLMIAATAMVLCMLFLGAWQDYWALMAASAAMGCALGCVLPSSAAIIAATFGAPSFAAVMSWSYALLLAFAVLAVRFTGTVYDRTGHYTLSFQVFGLAAAAMLAAILWRAPRRA